MKKILTLFILLIGLNLFSQNSGSILPSLNVPSVDLDPSVVIGLKNSPANQWKVILKDSIKWETYNINGLTMFIYNKGDERYPISNGTSSQYIAGDGTKITFPSIPAEQVNSDWDSNSGVSQILNKPTIPISTSQLINNSGFITDSSSDTFTNKSGNISQWTNNVGYLTGVTYSQIIGALGLVPIAGNQNISLTGDVTGSGTTSISTTLANTGVVAGGYGYVTVDSKGRVLSGKRLEPYTGTTSGSGTYTYTYSTPYSTIPNVQPVIRNQTNVNQFALLTSSTTTGFTITTYQRNTTTLLAVEVLLSSVSTVNGLTLDVIVTEK